MRSLSDAAVSEASQSRGHARLVYVVEQKKKLVQALHAMAAEATAIAADTAVATATDATTTTAEAPTTATDTASWSDCGIRAGC